MTFNRLLVANRGEIAVRIIKAARALGIHTIAVYSDVDEDALHVRLADEATNIGASVATKSYLNIGNIIDAAHRTHAEAIHPGYGFLAENAEFAAACEDHGIIFVGPSSEIIARMGDKAVARSTARAADVPIVPGTPEPVNGLGEAAEAAEVLGYPLMIKAAAGGGGRGIRVANDGSELERLLPQAQQEAKFAFGSDAVYLERLVRHARHVEVQVLGDGERVVHFFERECSIQRRRQKLVEEALAPCLTPELRVEMTAAAVRLAESVGYRGAGTVEFLVDPSIGEFYFIEMNTRIQVEHPVTEMVCGVDLVQEMIRIAQGEPLRFEQEKIVPFGWAIECRVNAEDPYQNFMPSPGTMTHATFPTGEDVRVDTALFDGYTIPPYYDSLIAKLIVWGQSRDEAIRKCRDYLDSIVIEGIHTTVPMLRLLMDDPSFVEGDFHTGYLNGWVEKSLAQEAIS